MARVTIIDDCKDTHKLLHMALIQAGHQVSSAYSAEEGLVMIRSSVPDLLLLDVEMPVRDGAWCLKEIRNDPHLRSLPVIMISFLPVREMVVRLAQLGVEALLVKDADLAKHVIARIAAARSHEAKAVPAGPFGGQAAAARTVSSAPGTAAPTTVAAAPTRHTQHPPSPPGARELPTPAALSADIEIPHAPGDVAVDEEWHTPSLEQAVEELRTLKPMISRADLIEAVTANNELRAMGPAARQVISLTGSASSSIDAIAKAIRQDQALSLKVLKLANSSLYSRGDKVDSVKKAVARIGVAQIRSTVMAMGVVSQFSAGGLAGRLKADRFWEHSITAGIIAQRLATALRFPPEEADQLFTAGLLHDIGRMLYAERLGELYAEVIAAADRLGLPLETVESRLLLINHADMTDRLLRQWKFPVELINPIALHHLSVGNVKRMVPRMLRPVATLALANRLAHALILGSSGNDVLYPIEEFVGALELGHDKLFEIMDQTPEQAFDMKTFMLASSDGAADTGDSALDDARAALGEEVRPLHVAVTPVTDAAGYMLTRLCTLGATDTPNVAVVRVAHATERPRIMDLLRQREHEEGASNLPALIIGSSHSCFFAQGQLGARVVEQVVAPVRRERVLHAMAHLVATPMAVAAA